MTQQHSNHHAIETPSTPGGFDVFHYQQRVLPVLAGADPDGGDA